MHIIETDRLSLTPLHVDEASELHYLWTSPEVRRHLWDDRIIPIDETRSILRQNMEMFAQQGFGIWGIRKHESPTLIGFGGYWYFREPPRLELILGLALERWGRGYATEAGRAIIRFGFEHLGFDTIWGSADAMNIQSLRLMQRLGMDFDRREMIDGLDTVFAKVSGV